MVYFFYMFFENISFPSQCFCFKAFLYSFTQAVLFPSLKYLCSVYCTYSLFAMSCLHTNKDMHTNKKSSSPGYLWCTEKFIPSKRIIFNIMVILLLQCSHVLTVIINKIRVMRNWHLCELGDPDGDSQLDVETGDTQNSQNPLMPDFPTEHTWCTTCILYCYNREFEKSQYLFIRVIIFQCVLVLICMWNASEKTHTAATDLIIWGGTQQYGEAESL